MTTEPSLLNSATNLEEVIVMHFYLFSATCQSKGSFRPNRCQSEGRFRPERCQPTWPRKDSLQKEFLHHAMERSVQGRIVEQGGRGAQPAVEMDHLIVSIDIVVLCDLLHPAHHQTLQDPA